MPIIWFDNVYDVDDSSEILNIKKLSTIRNMHGILNSLKRVECIVCHRETPGFDIHFSELWVMERGEKVWFTDNNIVKKLKKSKVLGTSVKLDMNFSRANQLVNLTKYVA